MPLVSPQETFELLQIISSENESLQQVYLKFQTRWPALSADRFRACCFLLLALEEGSIRDPTSRLNTLHILYSIGEGNTLGAAPFHPFLLQASQDLSRPKAERAFINSLFLGIGNNRDRPAVSLPGLIKQAQGIGSAQALWIAQNTRLPAKQTAGSGNRTNQLAQHSGINQIEHNNQYNRPSGQPALFASYKQQTLPLQCGELPWQHSRLPYLLRWDPSMLQDQMPVKDLQALLQAALLGPLLPIQQQQVLKELELERKVALSLKLDSNEVPQLVEHNPVIAFEVLVRLIKLGRGADYLPALANMEVSVHSMEVINRLSTAASLPSQFVHLYISSCIRSCQAAKDDKYMQLRRVRLVCVFLQSLIKNHIIDVQDLSYEAQAFCIEFSRVREAAALFRLLKTLENGHQDA